MAGANGIKDLDSWNPMNDDFVDPNFNSYTSGPGKNLPALQQERQQCTTLYVRGIPQHVDRNGLKHLFERFGGTVVQSNIRISDREGTTTNIGFVEMASFAEASDCIQQLNGHVFPKCNARLGVSFKRSDAEKARLAQTKELVEKYIDGFNRGDFNPVPPQQSTSDKENTTPTQKLASPQGAATNAKPQKTSVVRNNMKSGRSKPISQFEAEEENPVEMCQPVAEYGDCTCCGRPNSWYKCSLCLTFYCSVACQVEDWKQQHMQLCPRRPPPLQGMSLSNQESAPLHPSPVKAHPTREQVRRGNQVQSQTSTSSAPVNPQQLLPLRKPLKAVIKAITSLADFSIQYEGQTLPNAEFQCGLADVEPCSGYTWYSLSAMFQKLGMNLGQQVTVVCINNEPTNLVNVYMAGDSDVGDALIEAGVARLPAAHKNRPAYSLLDFVCIGDELKAVIDRSSVEGTRNFYSSLSGSPLKDVVLKFVAMEEQMTEYASSLPPESNVKSEIGDYVLAPFDSGWYRGEIYDANADKAVVGFIDFGNLALVDRDELQPLPRVFSHCPAIAVKLMLHQVTDAPDTSAAIAQLQALAGTPVDILVMGKTDDGLLVRLTCNGVDLGQSLIKSDAALPYDEPQVAESDNTVSQTAEKDSGMPNQPSGQASQSGSSLWSNSTSTPSDTPSQTQCSPLSRAKIDPLLRQGQIYEGCRLRKLDDTGKFCVGFPTSLPQTIDMLRATLSSTYSSSNRPPPVIPVAGMFVVFMHVQGEWRRGLILRTSSAQRIALIEHVDVDHESSKVPYDKIYHLPAALAREPRQALPVCQLANLADTSIQKEILRPHMNQALCLKVVDCVNGVYQVLLSHDGVEINEANYRASLAPHPPLRPKQGTFMARDCPKNNLKRDGCEVMLLEVESAFSFHVVNSSNAELKSVIAMIEEESQLVADTPSPTKLIAGQLVFASCPEMFPGWDRAVVMICGSPENVVLTSTEFGTTYTVPLRNTREITEKAARVPIAAIKCGLADIQGPLPNEALEPLLKLKESMIYIKVAGGDDPLQCIVSTPDGTNVNQLIKQKAMEFSRTQGREERGRPTHPGAKSQQQILHTPTTTMPPLASTQPPALSAPSAHLPALSGPSAYQSALSGPLAHPSGLSGPSAHPPALSGQSACPTGLSGTSVHPPALSGPSAHAPALSGPSARLPVLSAPLAHPPALSGNPPNDRLARVEQLLLSVTEEVKQLRFKNNDLKRLNHDLRMKHSTQLRENRRK